MIWHDMMLLRINEIKTVFFQGSFLHVVYQKIKKFFENFIDFALKKLFIAAENAICPLKNLKLILLASEFFYLTKKKPWKAKKDCNFNRKWTNDDSIALRHVFCRTHYSNSCSVSAYAYYYKQFWNINTCFS